MKAALLPLTAGLALATLTTLSNASESKSQPELKPLASLEAEALKARSGLKREWISPEAQLVLHFDFESFQKTSTWKMLVEHEDDINIELDEIRQEFGIDPFTDLKSLTAYSKTSDSDDGVAIITASGNIDQALARIQEEKEYRRVTVEGLELHVWSERGDDDAVAYIHPLTSGERVIVLSDHQASTIEAAKIVRGEAPNHLNGNGLLPITPAPDSFFYLSTASIPGVDDLPPASRIASLTKNIHIDLGETNGTLDATISAMASSPEDALQASKMIEGFKALGYFAAQEFGVGNLLEAIRVDTRGNQILINFSYNVRNLVEEIKALEDTHGPF